MKAKRIALALDQLLNVLFNGLPGQTVSARAETARAVNHATLAALTASATGNLAFPVWGVRLYISAFTAGYADLAVVQGY